MQTSTTGEIPEKTQPQSFMEKLKSGVLLFFMCILLTYVIFHESLVRRDELDDIYDKTNHNENETLNVWHRYGNYIFGSLTLLCLLSLFIYKRSSTTMFSVMNILIILSIIFEIFRVFQIRELHKKLKKQGTNVKLNFWELYGLFIIFSLVTLITLTGIIKLENLKNMTDTTVVTVTYLIVIILFITYNSMTTYRLNKLQRIVDRVSDSKLNFGWIYLSTNIIDIFVIMLLLGTLGLDDKSDWYNWKYPLGLLSIGCFFVSGALHIGRRYGPTSTDKKKIPDDVKDPVKIEDDILTFFPIICSILLGIMYWIFKT